MSTQDIHVRAEQLIARDFVEGISESERAWLDRHLRECEKCSAVSTATNAALLVGPAAAIDETLSSVFATLVKLRAGGVVIYPDPLFTARNEQLAALAHRYVLPAISAREFAVAGGLMGYGPDVAEAYRLAGAYAGRILKGERPADMPVQQS